MACRCVMSVIKYPCNLTHKRLFLIKDGSNKQLKNKSVESFHLLLEKQGLTLKRMPPHTLQVNVGQLCNLACKHCHVDAGPGRKTVMTPHTMADIIAFTKRVPFRVADITGGAPEMVPGIEELIEGLYRTTQKILLRSNLMLLLSPDKADLLALCRKLKIAIIASFPSVNEKQADAQRGDGVWEKSIVMLQRLNELGYGQPDSGLELSLVSNPVGAFLPVDQCIAEKRFKQDLAEKWRIVFNHLYTFANIPLGRFKQWLQTTGNFDPYMEKLAAAFNPLTLEGLMCRTMISVSWDGYLYDCDFNLAAGLPFSGEPLHVNDIQAIDNSIPIRTDDYCYACTAGAGFT